MIKPPFEFLPAELLQQLANLDTCSLSNAIERFGVHLRNEGYTDGSIRSCFPDRPPLLGYALTMQVRTGNPPVKGATYFEDTSWWDQLLKIPAPRLLVVQDVDRHPGTGALVGRVHAHVLKALGCAGVITNGAVRDLPKIRELDFGLFSGGLSVSHGYSHVVQVGAPVMIGGLLVKTRDLLHGDRHGVIEIPPGIAPQLPQMAAAMAERDQEIISHCEQASVDFLKLKSLVSAR